MAHLRRTLSWRGTVRWTESPNRGFKLQSSGECSGKCAEFGLAPVFNDAGTEHLLPAKMTRDKWVGGTSNSAVTQGERGRGGMGARVHARVHELTGAYDLHEHDAGVAGGLVEGVRPRFVRVLGLKMTYRNDAVAVGVQWRSAVVSTPIMDRETQRRPCI